jgi:hypothetical protein
MHNRFKCNVKIHSSTGCEGLGFRVRRLGSKVYGLGFRESLVFGSQSANRIDELYYKGMD